MTSDEWGADGQLSRAEGDDAVAWERVPLDPDLERDLGYRITDWDPITTANDDDQLVYLPAEEDLLRKDAFIVAARDDHVELLDER